MGRQRHIAILRGASRRLQTPVRANTRELPLGGTLTTSVPRPRGGRVNPERPHEPEYYRRDKDETHRSPNGHPLFHVAGSIGAIGASDEIRLGEESDLFDGQDEGKSLRAYFRSNLVRDHNFSLAGLEGFDLHGKTAGVIGTGRIGRLVAEILKGFGMRLLGYDAFPDPEWAARHGIAYTDPRTLACESDVVTLHLPLTPETRHLVRRETLDLMKPGAMLVNVSRGQLIDTKALIRALKSRRLGGVALDVYEEEEGIFFEDLSGQVLEDDVLTRLLTFPNVLITAHQAFLTREALDDIASTTVENVKRLTAGEPFLEGTSF
jgi:D-isomer specific 2-hydroxyacid dehydrogenase, NAD binding domain